MRLIATMLARLMLVAALSTPESLAFADSARYGLVFVKTWCSMCHAIGLRDESPLAIAPPFRTLHERYPIESLEEAFAEGIVTGHPTMPQFQLDVAQINALMAYFETLE